MIGIVLDTNVLVSANLKAAGLEAVVVAWALNGQIQLYISEPIFEEYERVLRYPQLRFAPEVTNRLLEKLRSAAILVHPIRRLSVCNHEPDNRFVECADLAGAEYLVTGNKRHFPSQRWKITRIVNARELVETLVMPKPPGRLF